MVDSVPSRLLSYEDMPLTLVDIKNHVFSHFMAEPTFNVAEDVAAIKLPKDDITETVEHNKVALFKTALQELARNGIVAEVTGTDGNVYILTQPLNTYTQQVVISPMVAEMVGDLVNGFSEALDDEGGDKYVANKMNISGEDVARLCHICHMLLNNAEDAK